MKENLAIFENFRIRRVYDEKAETWYFSVVDIIQVLTQQSDFQSARNYWKVLKNRLAKEGTQLVTHCNQLKLEATDGKKYRTDGPVGDPSDHSNFKFRRYCVEDIKAAVASIEDAGGKIVFPPFVIEHVGTVAQFEDTEGNTASVMQYLERGG